MVDTFQLIEREAAARILDMNGLDDAKPTELLDKMLALFPPSRETGFLFKEVFLRQLPSHLQSLVTQHDYPNLRDLAKATDRHFLCTGATLNAASRPDQKKRRDNLHPSISVS